ncbi:MAG: hypothetical protein JW830_06855 [Bacteroidales bacterium]|nr:hypothetical protein [Bacteroidales bacterium]
MKKYFIVLAVILPLLVLVIIKSLTWDHFRNDAIKWAESSFHESNILTTQQLNESDGQALIIELDDRTETAGTKGEVIYIPADKLLDKDYQKKLRAAGGSIVLVSDDPALSARMWMILSQLGYKKLYILNDSTDNEALKYKFQPDTVTRLEL